MATVYPPDNAGPWYCNDTEVTCNGYLKAGVHTASTSQSGPTCNGVGHGTGGGAGSVKRFKRSISRHPWRRR